MEQIVLRNEEKNISEKKQRNQSIRKKSLKEQKV